MKIGPLDTPAAAGAAMPERKVTAAPVAGAEPSARIELSSHATLGAAGADAAEFDAAKVERIAQAIRDGTFRIDAEAIADKLIANAQELLPKRQH